MSTKKWALLFGLLLVLAAVCALLLFLPRTDASVACIYQDGVLIRQVDLSKESGSFTVSYEGRENTVTVAQGQIYVSSADCPDQVCVKHGPLTGAEPIVCLPNRLVIRWNGEDSSGIDAVTGK